MIIIGSDEVGWGPVAGPLYVVAVAMPRTWSFQGLRDSKKLTRRTREAMFEPLVEQVRGNWSLAIRTPEQIDQLGAQACLVDAHVSVLKGLIAKTPRCFLDRVIVDGTLELPAHLLGWNATPVPKADDRFQVVSAASVIAKVLHDDVMTALSEKYPQYGFETNAGYETAAHLRALKRHGLCPAHRRSYLKKILEPS